MKPLRVTVATLALLLVVTTPTAIAQTPSAPPSAGQPTFQFKLGFKILADQLPDVVGLPTEDEHYGANGDSLQQTTRGLMAWRKADNWTAFTDGSKTWVNGPLGVQNRGNAERFPWEGQQAPTAMSPTDVPLWDRRGVPAAYIAAGDNTIYLWSGEAVAYLVGEDVYGFNGNHIGWYMQDIVWDWEGVAVGFGPQTHYVDKWDPPMSPRQPKPATSPREPAPAKPPLTLGVYTELLGAMLRMGVVR